MKNKAAFYTPALLIAVYLFLVAVRFIPSDVLGLDENPYLSVVLLQLLIYVVPTLFYCRLRGGELMKRLRIRPPKPGHLLALLHISVLLICGNALISMGMYRLFPEAFAASSSADYTAFARSGGVFDGMYMIVAFAVLPAVTEELLFRGVVVGEYEDYGPFHAAVVSSLTFAMSHFSLARLPTYLFCGLALALTLYVSRSLIATMLVHTLNNVSVLALEKYVLHIAEKQNISMILFILILVAAALIALILFCSEAGGIYRGYAEEALPVDYGRLHGMNFFTKIAETFFSPTFLILAAIFITVAMSR